MAVADGNAKCQIHDIRDKECRIAAQLVRYYAEDEAAKKRTEEEHRLCEGASPCIVADPVHLQEIWTFLYKKGGDSDRAWCFFRELLKIAHLPPAGARTHVRAQV